MNSEHIRSRQRLQDVRAEIAGIQGLTQDIGIAEFRGSWPVLRATQHALLIISEAVKNLPTDLTARRRDVPWNKIRALGNFLRHEYQRIDADTLWAIIQDQLPALDAAADLLKVPSADSS